MRLLLDEDVPQQLVEPIRYVLRGHHVKHVNDLGWSGKKDLRLYADAKGKFDAILTNDGAQLDDPDECRAIKDSGLHHVRYEVKNGIDGLAIAIGSVIASIRSIVELLEKSEKQLLVRVSSIQGKRYSVIDPAMEPPRYWPRKKSR